MEREFEKKVWIDGYIVSLLTAIWVVSSVVTVAQSGLIA